MTTWSVSSGPSVGVVASASIAASANGGYSQRLRAFQAGISGSGTGPGRLVIRDGATGVGTIIWQGDIAASLALSELDLRATAGNALTIEFTAGIVNDSQSVNAQGDSVPAGQPYGA